MALASLVRDVLPVVPVLHRGVRPRRTGPELGYRGGCPSSASRSLACCSRTSPWSSASPTSVCSSSSVTGSRPNRAGCAPAAQPRLLALWLVPAVGAGLASSVWTEQLQYNVVLAPLSLAGILALISVCAVLPTAGRAAAPTLQGVGRSSLVYYVSHFPVMVLVTQALLGVLPVATVVTISLVAALAVSTCLALVKDVAPHQLALSVAGFRMAGRHRPVANAEQHRLAPGRAFVRALIRSGCPPTPGCDPTAGHCPGSAARSPTGPRHPCHPSPSPRRGAVRSRGRTWTSWWRSRWRC